MMRLNPLLHRLPSTTTLCRCPGVRYGGSYCRRTVVTVRDIAPPHVLLNCQTSTPEPSLSEFHLLAFLSISALPHCYPGAISESNFDGFLVCPIAAPPHLADKGKGG